MMQHFRWKKLASKHYLGLLYFHIQVFGIFLPQCYFYILKPLNSLDHEGYFSLTKIRKSFLKNLKGYEFCQSPWVMNSFAYA